MTYAQKKNGQKDRVIPTYNQNTLFAGVYELYKVMK